MPINIDALAQEIRRVDGNHSLGAGALAEALMPFLSATTPSDAERHERAVTPQPVATQYRYRRNGRDWGNWRDRDYTLACSPEFTEESRDLFAAPPPPPPAAVQEPVAVKALVWQEQANAFPAPTWSAHTPLGFYNIEEISASDSPAFEVRLHAHRLISTKDNLDEAKAAAQTDYEQRIRSALSTSQSEPAPEIAALRAENERLRTALSFYADTSKYPAPFTGGFGELYFDCGDHARAALSEQEEAK